MKILCIHQWGTSGVVFEKQLSSVTGLLSPTYEYVYINGPYTCARARGLPDTVNGPFHCWYRGLSSEQCNEAHRVIGEAIAEDGPFEGVIAFSQGAATILSLLLHHDMHQPSQPPPFRFAILFCPIVVISPDPKFNAEHVVRYSRYYKAKHAGDRINNDTAEGLVEEAEKVDEAIGSRPPNGTASKPKSVPKHRALLLLRRKREALAEEMVDLVREMGSMAPAEMDEETTVRAKDMVSPDKPEAFPRIMHPLTTKSRVSIPTVVVVGKEDPFARQSELAVRLCENKWTKGVYLAGSHRVPVSPPEVRAVTAAVEWAIQKSQKLWQ
ncbi:serine hydrolase-domain-containing protein [Achaetomium macrosporum]|uniref:Serine hydrolase-domain-containing protein n=1 Tax=Achaetomium macrosporum TaxID=79813 RepID=A0AAN7C696_9PEZI|nr:serine hydrolase-domain-containing protein [Achaetomium macrosporum]